MSRPARILESAPGSTRDEKLANYVALLVARITGAPVEPAYDGPEPVEERVSDWDADRRADAEEARNERAFWGDAS